MLATDSEAEARGTSRRPATPFLAGRSQRHRADGCRVTGPKVRRETDVAAGTLVGRPRTARRGLFAALRIVDEPFSLRTPPRPHTIGPMGKQIAANIVSGDTSGCSRAAKHTQSDLLKTAKRNSFWCNDAPGSVAWLTGPVRRGGFVALEARRECGPSGSGEGGSEWCGSGCQDSWTNGACLSDRGERGRDQQLLADSADSPTQPAPLAERPSRTHGFETRRQEQWPTGVDWSARAWCCLEV